MQIENFNLTSRQSEQFETYFQELINYNEKVNLTAITDKEEGFIKHFYDSALAKDILPQNATVLDIGTGAGFPGLPLKIMRDDIKLTLVDSLNKRVEFLKVITDKLNLDVECIHSRAEDFAKTHREFFDVVCARAVASLTTLCEYTLPLVRVGGCFIAYKGANYKDELENAQNAIKLLGGKVKQTLEFELPKSMGSRALIIIEKIQHTNPKYPRPKNFPKLKPIK